MHLIQFPDLIHGVSGLSSHLANNLSLLFKKIIINPHKVYVGLVNKMDFRSVTFIIICFNNAKMFRFISNSKHPIK